MPTYQLSALEGFVWDRLDANSSFFPEPQVRLAINQALKRLNVLSGFNQATVGIPFTTAGKYLYAVPSGITIPLRVEYERRELQRIGLGRLARRYRNFLTDSTANVGPVQHWSRIGLTQFLIHPFDATGGRALDVTGVAPVPLLVKQADFINLEDQFMEIAVQYAAIRVQFKEPGAFQNASRSVESLAKKIGNRIAWQDMADPHQQTARSAR